MQDELPPTITEAEIAALLNWKVETFQKRRRALIEAGMPRPLPGTRVWSRALFLAWIDSDERLPASERSGVEDEAQEGEASYVGNVRRTLEARIGSGA